MRGAAVRAGGGLPRAPSQTRRSNAERTTLEASPADEESSTLLGGGGGGGGAGAAQTHADVLREQDATLDKLTVAVGALHELSGAITGELEQQAVMMEETSLAVEVVQGDVDAVTLRIRRLVEANGGGWWCSAVMALVAILVFVTWVALS